MKKSMKKYTVVLSILCLVILGSCATAGLYRVRSSNNSGLTINSMIIAKGKDAHINYEVQLSHAVVDGENMMALQFRRSGQHDQFTWNSNNWRQEFWELSGRVVVTGNIVIGSTDIEVHRFTSGPAAYLELTEFFNVFIDEDFLRRLFSEKRRITLQMLPVHPEARRTYVWIEEKDYDRVVGHINAFYQRFYGQPLGL